MRTASHPIDPQFTQRWSPRAMNGQPVAKEIILSLLEAARWAPSGGNGQPWQFLYATQGSGEFKTIFEALVPANQVWCKHGGAFVVVLSKTVRADGKPATSHAFEAGAAWMSLALEGSKRKLVVHAMGGFDAAKVREHLSIPGEIAIHCVVVVGNPGDRGDLPEPLRSREEPNDRLPLEAFSWEGRYPSAGAS